jgi:nicotinamidase-related amidase
MPQGGFPAGFTELADGLAQPGDLRITKRQWGAFHGTELDLQLRRRDIQTIVLGGIATNIGVESTARQAWENGYAVVLAEDATSGMSAEMHEFAIKNIFPRLSRIVKAGEIQLNK